MYACPNRECGYRLDDTGCAVRRRQRQAKLLATLDVAHAVINYIDDKDSERDRDMVNRKKPLSSVWRVIPVNEEEKKSFQFTFLFFLFIRGVWERKGREEKAG